MDTRNRKLSLAFSLYNTARAEARRLRDTKRMNALNKVLGNLVRDAHRAAHGWRQPKTGLPGREMTWRVSTATPHLSCG